VLPINIFFIVDKEKI